MTNGSLMKVESIAEVLLSKVLLQGEHSAILWPALSDNGLENQFVVFLRVAVLLRVYCINIWCGVISSSDESI